MISHVGNLRGRAAELAAIDGLIKAARGGGGGALAVLGEAGIGLTSLLDRVEAAATGVTVLRTAGHPAERGHPYAALHLLVRPVRARIGELPPAHAAGLGAALDRSAPGRDDPALVRVALLALLSRLAEDGPLLCLVDDAHGLDPASADALLFAARRLDSQRIAMVLTAHDDDALGLPELRPARLAEADAAALLEEIAPPPARDRVVAEAQGNPLALVELAGALTPDQRTGAFNPFCFHAGAHLSAGVLRRFRPRLDALPEPTRALLLVAAADDTRDPDLVWAAAGELGATPADYAHAERAGVLRRDNPALTFTHPLLRAAAYHQATCTEARAAHRALAAAAGRPEPEGWHLAAALAGRDRATAARLERLAARSPGAARYAAYARSAELTPDPRIRARRALAAARAACDAGLLDGAAEFAARASAARVGDDPESRAELARVQATIEFERGAPAAACRTMIDVAGQVGERAPSRAYVLLTEAVRCAWYLGESGLVRDATTMLRALPAPGRLPEAPARSRGPLIPALGPAEGDGGDRAARRVAECRDAGLAGALPYALQELARTQLARGRLAEARSGAAEALERAAASGLPHLEGHLKCLLGWIAAVEGDEERCLRLVTEGMDHASERGLVPTLALGSWALAVLDMGRGRFEPALARLERPAPFLAGVDAFGRVHDLIEAAARCGRPKTAARRLALLELRGGEGRRSDVLAKLERCRGILAGNDAAEGHYTTALSLHEKGDNPYERARTELLYGEWLRRARRRAEARVLLGAAMERFERLGARPWAARAEAELVTAGGPAGVPGPTVGRLTHQELRIVRLAAAGASNRQIATRLALSPRTVGNHLYRAFPKLGIRERSELSGLDLGEPDGD